MDKSPDAFRTISEVSEWLDTPAHVLRFWESRFPQIRPVKRAGGRRYYRPADVALLGGIKKLLHDDGLTIRGVQKMLREQGIRYVAGLAGGEETASEAAEAPPATTAAATQLPFDLGDDAAGPAAEEAPEAEELGEDAATAAPEAEPMLEDPVVEESLLPESPAEDIAEAQAPAEAVPPLPSPAPASAERQEALRVLYRRLSGLRDRMAEASRRTPR